MSSATIALCPNEYHARGQYVFDPEGNHVATAVGGEAAAEELAAKLNRGVAPPPDLSGSERYLQALICKAPADTRPRMLLSVLRTLSKEER